MQSMTEKPRKSRRGNPPGTGRPRAVIDWEKVNQMFIAGCNGAQVAARLGIHPDTLYDACERDHKTTFSAYFQEKREDGNAILHMAQFHKAVKEKNTQMLIHLGEFRLGQIKGAVKQTQDLLEGLNDIVEDFRDSKKERSQDTKS